MLLTNLEDEIMGVIHAKGLTWQQVGDGMGTTRQEAYDTVHRRKQGFIAERVIRLIEGLGYDVEIKLVERK